MNTSSYGSSSGLAHAGAGTVTSPITKVLLLLLLLTVLVEQSRGNDNSRPEVPLTQVSLEDLGDIEVTTVSKEPVKASQTPAAIYVITQEDIRRSGMTSLPDLLRMVPGLHVGQIQGGVWAISARGFNDQYSNKMLVLVDGRSVYSPTNSGVLWDEQETLLDVYKRALGMLLFLGAFLFSRTDDRLAAEL